MHGGREMREAMKPHRRRISRRPCARRPSPAAGWPLLVQSRSGAAFTDRLSMLALHRSPSADKIGQSKFIVFAGQDTSFLPLQRTLLNLVTHALAIPSFEAHSAALMSHNGSNGSYTRWNRFAELPDPAVRLLATRARGLGKVVRKRGEPQGSPIEKRVGPFHGNGGRHRHGQHPYDACRAGQ